MTIGMLAYNGAFLVTRHYTVVAPFHFTAIIVGYLVSIFRYGEEVNVFCVVGALAIVVGVICILLNKVSNPQKETSSLELSR